jgi:hypothetical protein
MPLAAVEAMACKHFLRSPRGHLRKDRSPTGQSHIGRPRQMENVITVQEHREHVRTADDANAAVWRPESQGLLERSTRRVPEQRLFIRRVGRNGRDLPGQDQSAAQIRTRLSLMRLAPMHHHIDAVEPAFEEVLLGLEFERVR